MEKQSSILYATLIWSLELKKILYERGVHIFFRIYNVLIYRFVLIRSFTIMNLFLQSCIHPSILGHMALGPYMHSYHNNNATWPRTLVPETVLLISRLGRGLAPSRSSWPTPITHLGCMSLWDQEWMPSTRLFSGIFNSNKSDGVTKYGFATLLTSFSSIHHIIELSGLLYY